MLGRRQWGRMDHARRQVNSSDSAVDLILISSFWSVAEASATRSRPACMRVPRAPKASATSAKRKFGTLNSPVTGDFNVMGVRFAQAAQHAAGVAGPALPHLQHAQHASERLLPVPSRSWQYAVPYDAIINSLQCAVAARAKCSFNMWQPMLVRDRFPLIGPAFCSTNATLAGVAAPVIATT